MPTESIPAGTVIGHVHLKVADLGTYPTVNLTGLQTNQACKTRK